MTIRWSRLSLLQLTVFVPGTSGKPSPKPVLQDAPNPGERPRQVAEVHHAETRNNPIEAPLSEGQIVYVRDAEFPSAVFLDDVS